MFDQNGDGKSLCVFQVLDENGDGKSVCVSVV